MGDPKRASGTAGQRGAGGVSQTAARTREPLDADLITPTSLTCDWVLLDQQFLNYSARKIVSHRYRSRPEAPRRYVE